MDAYLTRTHSVRCIRDRLMRARFRSASAARGSPEWDAALAEIEALEAVLERQDPEYAPLPRRRGSSDQTP